MWWALIVVAGLGKSSLLLNCTDIDGHLIVPNGTVKIPDNKYKNCNSITGVTFNTDGALETIGLTAFKDSQLGGPLFIPKSVKEIKGSAFYKTKITSLVFEEGSQVSLIENSVFGHCYNLTGAVKLPQDVTEIYPCFSFTTIESIEIPQKTRLIHGDVLLYKPHLNRVVVPGDDPFCHDTDNEVFDDDGDSCYEPYKYGSSGHFCGLYDDSDFNATEMCCYCGGGNFDGSSGTENVRTLQYLVLSLCSNVDNQICIDGNGTRAGKIVNHTLNDCGLVCCEGSTCGTATTPPNDEEESSDETTLTTGAIIGIAVGSFVLLSTLACVYHRQRKGTPSQPSSSTSLGYLVF